MKGGEYSPPNGLAVTWFVLRVATAMKGGEYSPPNWWEFAPLLAVTTELQ